MSARQCIADRLWWQVPSANDAEAKAGAEKMLDAYRDEVLAEDAAARDRMQRALLFALAWHGTSPAELREGINKILTEDGGR